MPYFLSSQIQSVLIRCQIIRGDKTRAAAAEELPREMDRATTLMASSSVPTKPASAHLASCNSDFFSNGGSSRGRRLGMISARGRRPPPASKGCRCLFGLGVPEIAVIAGVAALVFGPKNIPEVGKSIGKTLKSFQQAAKEFETELKKEPEDSSNLSVSAASPKPVSNEDEKKEREASDAKEST